MRKVLFFSVILMGTVFCCAQENTTRKRDTRPKSMLENIEEIDYDRLGILDGRSGREIDEKYKILYQRVRKESIALHALPASYLTKVCKTWNVYKD